MALRAFSAIVPSSRWQLALVSANMRNPRSQKHQRQHISTFQRAPGTEEQSVAGMTVAFERALREQRTEEAIRAYQHLRIKGSFPSKHCISTLLAQLAYKQSPTSLNQADRLVQDITSKNRTDLLDHHSLSLLALSYAGVGMPTYARATLHFMFQTKHYPSVKVWVAVVTKIAENRDEAPAALQLFKDICELTRTLTLPDGNYGKGGQLAAPSGASTRLGLEDSSDPVARIMRLMDHALSLKDDRTLLVQMKPDLSAFNSALSICAKLGLVQAAEDILQSMSGYGFVPDVGCFNTMIKVYGKAGLFHMFGRVSQMMEAAGVRPNGDTLKTLLDSYVEGGRIYEAESLLRRCLGPDSNSMWQLLKLDADIYNSLLKAYAAERDLDAGAKLLSSLPEDDGSNLSQGKVVWSMVASGLITEIYSIIQHMAFLKMPLHYAVYRSLIQGFASNNQLDRAAGVMVLMKRAAIKPDATCYGPLILGLIRCGDLIIACHTFDEMIEARIIPDESIYVPLFKALSVENHASKMLKVMYGLLDCRVNPEVYSWNLVIESLSKRNMVVDAKRMLLRMEPTGVQPDSFSFWYVVKGLITGCKLVEVVDLWPFILKAITKNELVLQKELVDSLLYAFIKGAFFGQALEMLKYAKEQNIPVDREAFRDLFLRYHSFRFTSKHKSARRVLKRQPQVQDMERLKEWLKLDPVKIPVHYWTQF